MNKYASLASCLLIALGMSAASSRVETQQNPRDLVIPSTAHVQDVFTPLLPQEVALQGGFLGVRVDANEKHRMLKVDEDDLLDAFERRDVRHQDWQGEHVGKFLHAATLAWNYSHDPNLKVKIDRVVARLLKTQESDGYLGTYRQDERWRSWDVWVHKYDLLGLLTYYQFTKLANGNQPTPLGSEALNACRKVGDLLIATFGTEPGKRDINRSGEHVGMAPDSVLEPIVLLYRATNEQRYLDFARYIVTNYDAPGGPAILASLESKKSVRAVANAKAYEMLSNFNGLLELYRVTGDKRLLSAMQIAWRDVVQNRLYITGSASSGELFQEKYHLPNRMYANICETCVTVTWEQMNLQLLRLTGEARYADELEKSVYNHLLAAQKPTGDDWAYYTPLEGHKPYDSQTTCCHSSGPRGVALIPEIAYMTSADGGLVVNFYNNGTVIAHLKSGEVSARQATQYPLKGDVWLTILPAKNGQKFPLRLRIPPWAPKYAVALNGRPLPQSGMRSAGSGYIVLNRAWHKNDRVHLMLAIPDRVVVGDHENAGKAAILYGPLVLALDSAENHTAALRSIGLGFNPTKPYSPNLKLVDSRVAKITFTLPGEVAGSGKTTLSLVPYAEAGGDGKSDFKVWIPISAPTRTVWSLLSGSRWRASRRGNVMGDLTDDDTMTFAVTFNGRPSDTDWFAVRPESPVTINRVVFVHGKTFHDGGWFDTEGGVHKPAIQIQTERGGTWQTVATLDSYPNTTATDAAGLQSGQTFEATFPAMTVVAIRVLGKPACGDTPAQAFASCAELQAFYSEKK
jgi:DUF1680 family protein